MKLKNVIYIIVGCIGLALGAAGAWLLRGYPPFCSLCKPPIV